MGDLSIWLLYFGFVVTIGSIMLGIEGWKRRAKLRVTIDRAKEQVHNTQQSLNKNLNKVVQTADDKSKSEGVIHQAKSQGITKSRGIIDRIDSITKRFSKVKIVQPANRDVNDEEES